MSKHPARVAVLGLSVLLAAAVQSARAENLATKVPSDALAYASWAGSDALGSAYDGSRLKDFLEALNIPQLLGRQFDQALARETDPQRVEEAKFAQQLLGALAKAPTALYVGPLDFSINPAQPVPRIALFSKVGSANAGALAPRLNTALTRNHRAGDPAVAAVAAGEYLLVYVGDADLHTRLEGLEPAAIRSLADSDAFKDAFKNMETDVGKAAAAVYFDARAAADMLSTIARARPEARVRELYPAIAEGLGLNSVGQFAWAGNFDGTAWRSSTFLGMREKRPGLLALLDHGPLSQASLKLVPRSATSAGAFRFDGMRLLSDIAETAGKVNDQAPKQIDTALTDVYVWSGIDLKRELLPSFGDEFVYYGSPEGAGNSLRGFTMVNRLRDAKKADAAVTSIEDFVNLLVAQRNPDTKLQFKTQALPAPWDKVTAHVLQLENFAPAWAIANDTFVFSMSLAGLQSALDMTAGGRPSILENPTFMSLRQKLGRDSFGAFSYSDLPGNAPETYELVNHLVTLAQARNPNLSGFVLPPLSRISPALSPAMTVSWTDEQGYHAKESSPFPMAGYLSPSTYVGLVLAQQVQARREAERVAPAARPAAPGGQGGLP